MELLNFDFLINCLYFLSALVLFLFSIDCLSKSVQNLISEDLTKKISKLAKNKFVGFLTGFGATALVHSSTAVTIITIALVNTGVISFSDSLAVMLGSSVGTTITAFFVLLDSTPVAPILIIVGYLIFSFSKRYKSIGSPILYLGLMIFALNLLSDIVAPLSGNVTFVSLFEFVSNPLVAFGVSLFLTVLVHSSTVTTGLIVILVQASVIDTSVAIPMILGANLGTTFSALFSCLKLNLYAKRAAVAHVLFTLIGVVVFMIFVDKFEFVLALITDNMAQQVALGHFLFNLVCSLFFLFLLRPLQKLVEFVVPGKEEEVLFETRFIDGDVTKSLSESVMDVKNELIYSLDNTKKIYNRALSLYASASGSAMMEVQKLESLNDFLDDEITNAILSLSRYKLSKRVARETVLLVKISNTIEQLGDLGEDFAEVFQRMYQLDVNKDDVQIDKLTEIFNMLMGLFDCIEKEIVNPNLVDLQNIKKREERIYVVVRNEYDEHVAKLERNEDYDGSIFVDAVSVIELSVSKLRDIRKLLMKYVMEIK